MKNVSLYVALIIIIPLIVFGIWHFFLSIYEVKFQIDSDDNNLKLHSTYKISCSGLNSLGWHINYRDFGCEFEIEKGNELVKIETSNKIDEFNFHTQGCGNVVIIVKSKFSRNDTRFNLVIME